ncbi:glycosyltransferase family 39 protein [Aromatoleum toluvorans]|uniref:Glycosyltransferase family 39 protein n=1 Tax=Aromatoleum toluvorans TaxID=92002 RepID=A0ABX1PXE5_9RHOO|nr:glycosyltransferase family 39 protein [Aromatoleum toluvorans]NMG42786.1 glycosyltransferase family 39 protein [Aromatoleum toluvorans]
MSDSVAPLPQPRSWQVIAIFLLPLVAFFLRLGGAPLFDVDEGAFSEATREMFERGDFLSTYLNGEHRFDKPILVYWLQALGYLLFGATEWGFRLPSAVAGVLWSYATWHFARERFGSSTALAALAVASTALGPFAIGRAATADALLNLLLALALFDAWRHLESGRRAPLLRSFVWIGLGALTKGPIALIVPGTVSLLYCASRGEWKRWARAVFDPAGLVILALIVVPWYAAALAIHGQLFIDGFILKHNVERFTGTLEGHAGSLFYYVIAVPLLLLPWTGPLLASVRQVRGDVATGVRRFLWIWAIFVVAFFSVSGTKLPHYVLYGSTPLFLLIAVHRNELRRTALHLAAPTLFLAVFPLLPLIFNALSASDAGSAYYRALLQLGLAAATPEYYLITIGGLFVWLWLAARWNAAAWMKVGAAAAIQVVVLAGVVVPWAGAVLQGPVKEAGLLARKMGEPVVAWRYYAPSFSVYRQAVTPGRAPEAGELAITRADRLPASGVDVLYRKGGVALVRKSAESEAN